MTSAPYITKASEAAWRKRVRQEHQECKKRNPTLMRRLAKLSDDQLLRLEIAVLELEQPSPARDQQLRLALQLQTLRSAPKPVKRGGKVPRLRSPLPPERQHATLQETPRGLAGLGGPDLSAPTPTVGPPAAPPAPKPSNVVPLRRLYIGPKFFHNGRSTPRWIGGET